MRKDNSFNSLLVETLKRHRREVIIGAAVACALVGCILLILCAPASPQSARAASESVGTDLAVVSQAQAKAGDDMTRRMQEIYDYLVQLDGMVTDNQSTLEAVRSRADLDKAEEESVSVIQEQLQGDVVNLSDRMSTIHDELTETKKLIETVNEVVEGGGALDDEKTVRSFTEISKSIETVNSELTASVTEIKKLVESMDSSSSADIKALTETLNSVKSSIERAQTKSFSSVSEELEDIKNSYMAAMESIQSKLNGSFDNLGVAVEKLSSDVTGVSGGVNKVGQDVNAVSGSISQVGDSVNTVKGSVDKTREEVVDIGTNVAKARQDVADVDVNVRKVGQDVTGVNDNINKAIEDVASVNSNVDEAKKAVNGVNSNVDKAIEGVAGVNDNVNRVGENIDAISGSVDKLGSNVDIVGQGVALIDTKTDDLKGQINAVKDEINSNITALDSSVQTKFGAVNGELERLFQRVSNGKQKLAAALLTKNVEIDPASTWDQFKAAIESIQQRFIINGNEVPANAVYEYHKHSTDPNDMVSWSVEGPEDMSTNPAEVNNDVAVGPEYQGGCFTAPIYHMHGDECDRRVTSVTASTASESWTEITSVGQCITCGSIGYTYRYDAVLDITTKITHPKEEDQVSVDQKTLVLGKVATGGRTGYRCESCIKRAAEAEKSRLEYVTSELACYLDGAVIGYQEDCPYVKGQVVRAHLTFPGG